MADDLTGKAKHVGGKIEEAVGDLLGDSKIKREGKLRQVEGNAEQDQARAEDAAVEAATRKQAAQIAKEQNKRTP